MTHPNVPPTAGSALDAPGILTSPRPPRRPPTWDQYFLAVAKAVALRSKDPDTQMGAVVVNDRHLILGTGFNGPPCTINDASIDWARPNKYDWVIHAEENALWATGRNGVGATLYVTAAVCGRCMLRVAHAGVCRIVQLDRPYASRTPKDAALAADIARRAGITVQTVPEN